MGSSPLTRGKLRQAPLVGSQDGLIPAHAGKTTRKHERAYRPGAHPRSRGENDLCHLRNLRHMGSSPLTRGKPHEAWTTALQARLIPAHAGKTN